MRFAPFLMVVAVVGGLSGRLVAAEGDQVRAELLMDAKAIAPGQSFRVGVLFHVEPKWHIYWRNPGDSGLPTNLKFKLPEGFEASAVYWPTPRRFVQPGDLLGYGYEEQVLLWADVKAPASLKAGQDVKVGVFAQWLVCQKACLEGSKELATTVGVAEKPEPGDAAKVFDEWRQRLPQPAAGVAEIAPTGALQEGKPAPFTIEVRWKGTVKDVEWFPAPEDALAVTGVDVKTEGTTTRISFKSKVLKGQKLQRDSLDSVLAYTDEAGQRRGLSVSLALKAK
jgi:thiol:disulfide interchange protein DsbD